MCIETLLNEKDLVGIDRKKAVEYILSCRNYNDGAFGLNPCKESHGGATFCAIASLYLLNKLNLIDNKSRLVNWIV